MILSTISRTEGYVDELGAGKSRLEAEGKTAENSCLFCNLKIELDIINDSLIA